MRALVLVAFCFSTAARADASFKCRDEREVKIGSTVERVLATCGEPTSIQRHVEERPGPPDPADADREAQCEKQLTDLWNAAGQPQPQPDLSLCAPVRKALVLVEEWAYDQGENVFVRYLRFEDGVLRSIRAGGYGR